MSNFDNSNYCSSSVPCSSEGERCDHSSPDALPDALDNLKRDRFELLSAYLDGEVTADERRQVEAWLVTDTKIQRLYNRLLKLRQGVRTLPVPQSEKPVEHVAAQVITQIERRPKRRIAWGGMAIAALFVGAIFGTLPQAEWSPSISQSSNGEQIASDAAVDEGLMIALDRPVIEIPKAAVTDPGLLVYPQGDRLQ